MVQNWVPTLILTEYKNKAAPNLGGGSQLLQASLKSEGAFETDRLSNVVRDRDTDGCRARRRQAGSYDSIGAVPMVRARHNIPRVLIVVGDSPVTDTAS